jgi:two-component system sensor histidine kinase UhpB
MMEVHSGRWRRAAIILFATIVLAIGWSYGLWRIQNDRAITLQASHEQLATLSRGLASQLKAMVNDGVGAARAGANAIQNIPGQADPAGILGDMLTGGEYVRALFIATPDHLIIANASGEGFAEDNATWLATLRNTTDSIWVGPISLGADGLKLPLAQRIQHQGESGWAGALVRMSDLEQVYTELRDTTLSLVTLSGRVIVQLPEPRAGSIDVDVSDSEVYRKYMAMPAQEISLLVGPRPGTGEPRQYAICRLEPLPLLAVSSRSIDDVLAGWRERKLLSLQLLFVATLIVYTLALALQLLLNRRFVALERSEARFRLAASGTNDGLLEWEAETGMVYCTPRACELLHLPGGGHVGLDAVRELIDHEDLPLVITAFRRHIDDHVPLDVEARLLVRGERRWFRIRGQALWNDAGEPLRLAGAIGDIHDAVLAQQAIAQARRAELEAKESLARELLRAQENERKRLAGELHDGIGQNLSLLRNRAVLLQRTALPPEAMIHAQALVNLSTESIQDLRTVAQNLRPIHLEELGISASLRSLLQRVDGMAGLKVQFRIEDFDDVIAGDAATHVYRIVQEAINNVIRHAAATEIVVDVIRDISQVVIDIRDDGKGCELDGGLAQGLGLLSIRERCGMLSAQLQMNSASGRGMQIRISIPLEVGHA